MIQTIGMGSTAFFLILFKVPFYKKFILPISLGGILGLYPGIKYVAPLIPPNYCKIFFTSLWLSFGVWIFIIEKFNAKKNGNFQKLDVSFYPQLNTKNFLILCFVGFLGGLISSITGTGT